MYQVPVLEASFLRLLQAIDEEIAADCRKAGCPVCGGVLHSAMFRRKPRGCPAGLEAGFDLRHSFCCATDGCRKRVTPASVRFLGRKVYPAAVVTVIGALMHGETAALRRLAGELGVCRRTVRRWRTWWLTTFAGSRFWKQASAAFLPPAAPARLPLSVLERFVGDARHKLVALLRWLGPVTGGASAAHAF